MKIFAYTSSLREKQSNSLIIIKEVIKLLDNLCLVEEYNIATPDKDPIELCSGCMKCVELGKCIKESVDHLQSLKDKMLSADVIILASPVFLHNVNGPMKNFLDRLSLWSYTMPLAGKLALPITVSNTNGNKYVDAYLTYILNSFGAGTLEAMSIKASLMSKETIRGLTESVCMKIKRYIRGQETFTIPKCQEEYYKQMKKMLINIDKETRLYKIWEENGMFAYHDYQSLFSSKREEMDRNEKC